MTETIRAVIDRIEMQQINNALQLRPEANSLDFLQVIYRNPSLALPVRMRAAIAALPFEQPKLAVTAQVSESDFATLLDRRIKRFEEMKLVEAKPSAAPTNGDKSDARLLPRLADRRFRRI
jgi:hypothetical protein